MNNTQNDFISGIGNTPLIKLRAASEITGCNIYGKAEFLNPGGSVKDRAALALIKDAHWNWIGSFGKFFRLQNDYCNERQSNSREKRFTKKPWC